MNFSKERQRAIKYLETKIPMVEDIYGEASCLTQAYTQVLKDLKKEESYYKKECKATGVWRF
ncbi:MAG TPA: hypothetical protein ENI73_02065 [Spirochaetes bacterium]|nr:hypothetical protein [Spirochaetota bacterium]